MIVRTTRQAFGEAQKGPGGAKGSADTVWQEFSHAGLALRPERAISRTPSPKVALVFKLPPVPSAVLSMTSQEGEIAIEQTSLNEDHLLLCPPETVARQSYRRAHRRHQPVWASDSCQLHAIEERLFDCIKLTRDDLETILFAPSYLPSSARDITASSILFILRSEARAMTASSQEERGRQDTHIWAIRTPQAQCCPRT